MPVQGLFCDCCGLPVDPGGGEDCPRCGYPVQIVKEERFLKNALHDLQRVATHGGAYITVAQLISRYQARVYHLHLLKTAPTPASPTPGAFSAVPTETTPRISPPLVPVAAGASTQLQPPVSPLPSRVMNAVHGQREPPPVLQAPAFSLRTFFADQSINIVASLGAFLILVGSLGFVATTPDLLLSFLVMFAVHAVFGLVGVTSYRFRSLRVVAGVYTAIFALLVPLVGFSGYRLVVDRVILLSAPTLVAMMALYAAIVYCALAVYQRFKAFGYLAMMAVVVADLATASALRLTLWWWPVLLMLLAFPALFVIVLSTTFTAALERAWQILCVPVRALMYISVGAACTALLFSFVFFSLLSFDVGAESRFAVASMLLLLSGWLCLFVWLQHVTKLAPAIPYVLLVTVVSCAYALDFRRTGYVLTLTAVAWLYHVSNRYASSLLRLPNNMKIHIEVLALLAVGVVPLIVDPMLPRAVWLRQYSHSASLPVLVESAVSIPVLIACCALPLSVALSHTGWRSWPDARHRAWRWLLLLSGYVLVYMYALIALLLNGEPVWWFLSLTLGLAAAALLVRRLVSAAWADPLDVLALAGSVLTLLLCLRLSAETITALLFFFAVLTYCVVFYQRRPVWAWLSAVFAGLALPLLPALPAVFLVMSLLFPLMAAIVHFIAAEGAQSSSDRRRYELPSFVQTWEGPLLVIGLVYGLICTFYEAGTATGVVKTWFAYALSGAAALEVAALALAWYAAAALTRIRWWLAGSILFGILALLMPGISFWVLAWLAPLFALLALAIHRLADRSWALPLYIVAILAALMMGRAAYDQNLLLASIWTLFIFAGVLYLVGVVQNEPVLLWLAPCFALWATYTAGQSGSLYIPVVTALGCAALGAGIVSLKSVIPAVPKIRFIHYRLPLYATACGAVILAGTYGMLAGIHQPFYAALPDALFLFALVAYGISVLERCTPAMILVAVLAVWGTSLALDTTVYYMAAVAAGALLLGFVSGRVVRLAPFSTATLKTRGAWNWPWYVTALLAAVLVGSWESSHAGGASMNSFIILVLLVFAVATWMIMLEMQTPELLVIPAGFAAWSVTLVQWPLWQTLVAGSFLCVLIFSLQFVWRIVASGRGEKRALAVHSLLSVGGQVCVVVIAMGSGVLLVRADVLTHVGAAMVLVLAGLVFWFGSVQGGRALRHWCSYAASLLLALAVSWDLVALDLVRFDVLSLPPASCLIVFSPFLMRDQTIPGQRRIGQLCAVVGAALLLLPTLWSSFSEDNLQPTILLAGESLALFLLGILIRMRVFILSGAALVIISAMHALFLPSLGIPTPVALVILGGTLLAVATGLSLARRRLQDVWSHWQ